MRPAWSSTGRASPTTPSAPDPPTSTAASRGWRRTVRKRTPTREEERGASFQTIGHAPHRPNRRCRHFPARPVEARDRTSPSAGRSRRPLKGVTSHCLGAEVGRLVARGRRVVAARRRERRLRPAVGWPWELVVALRASVVLPKRLSSLLRGDVASSSRLGNTCITS